MSTGAAFGEHPLDQLGVEVLSAGDRGRRAGDRAGSAQAFAEQGQVGHGEGGVDQGEGVFGGGGVAIDQGVVGDE